MAKKIFVGNYKGGVGKTTSVLHIAKFISEIEKNKKVLIIDLDPQCSLSEICMNKVNDRNLESLGIGESLNYVLEVYYKKIKKYDNIKIKLNMEKLTQKYNNNVDFIPSNLFDKEGKKGLDTIISELQKYEDSILILSQFFIENSLDEEYDYIIFDCPPANNIVVQSAFLLSNYYLIPTIMDNVSARGVVHYVKSVNKTYSDYCEEHEDSTFMKAIFGEKPMLLGVFETLYKYNVSNGDVRGDLGEELDRTYLVSLEKEMLKEVGEKEFNIIFKNNVSNYIDIARSTAMGNVHFKAQGYKEITREMLERIVSLDSK